LTDNLIRFRLIDDIRALGRKPSKSGMTKISAWREGLQAKIESFHEQAALYMGNVEWDDSMLESPKKDEDLEDSDEESEDDLEGDYDDMDDLEQDHLALPEKVTLLLPSSFGQRFCLDHGLDAMVDQEKELRKAQAHEYLDNLRLALGLKSALFRKMVRTAKSQKTKTRAWGRVHHVNANVKAQARGYRRAREALIRLGVKQEKMNVFQELMAGDLKMSSDIVEENRVGQRSDGLSWIWRVEGGMNSNQNIWIEEGTSLISNK
jgi:hypothetical protein